MPLLRTASAGHIFNIDGPAVLTIKQVHRNGQVEFGWQAPQTTRIRHFDPAKDDLDRDAALSAALAQPPAIYVPRASLPDEIDATIRTLEELIAAALAGTYPKKS